MNHPIFKSGDRVRCIKGTVCLENGLQAHEVEGHVFTVAAYIPNGLFIIPEDLSSGIVKETFLELVGGDPRHVIRLPFRKPQVLISGAPLYLFDADRFEATP